MALECHSTKDKFPCLSKAGPHTSSYSGPIVPRRHVCPCLPLFETHNYAKSESSRFIECWLLVGPQSCTPSLNEALSSCLLFRRTNAPSPSDIPQPANSFYSFGITLPLPGKCTAMPSRSSRPFHARIVRHRSPVW